MIYTARKAGCRAGSCAIAWNIIVAMIVFAAAPAQAQVLQPSIADLLGFECRVVQGAECACSPVRGQPTISYTEITDIFERQPAQSANGLLRQAIWRRQCGMLTEADTAP